MIKIYNDYSILIYCLPIDMRKSIDGLCNIISNELSSAKLTQTIFIFFNRHKDKVKILFWDRNGFALHYKRLEKGKFKMSSFRADTLNISEQQLGWLLAGLDFQLMNDFFDLEYSNFS